MNQDEGWIVASILNRIFRERPSCAFSVFVAIAVVVLGWMLLTAQEPTDQTFPILGLAFIVIVVLGRVIRAVRRRGQEQPGIAEALSPDEEGAGSPRQGTSFSPAVAAVGTEHARSTVFEDQRPEEPTWSEGRATAEAAERKQPAQRSLRAFLASIARLPVGTLEMVRAGKAADASIRCLAIGGLALALVFVFSMFLSICMVVTLIPLAIFVQAPVGDEPVVLALIIVLSLPGIVSALIAIIAPVVGAGLGLVGLFQHGKRFLSAASVVLNVLLLAFDAFVAIFTIGLAG